MLTDLQDTQIIFLKPGFYIDNAQILPTYLNGYTEQARLSSKNKFCRAEFQAQSFFNTSNVYIPTHVPRWYVDILKA